MNKLKPLYRVSFAGLLIIAALLSSLIFSAAFNTNFAAAATQPPPLDPGCYTRASGSSNQYTSVTCPNEGRARAVSDFDACFVGTDEKDCNDPSLPGNKVPAPSNENQNSNNNNSSDPTEIGSSGEGVFDTGDKDCDVPGQDLTSENCAIIEYLVVGINLLSALAGMAIVFSIMYAGFQYMTAQDNSGAIQQARSRIIWALTALVLFVFIYALLNFLIPGGVLWV